MYSYNIYNTFHSWSAIKPRSPWSTWAAGETTISLLPRVSFSSWLTRWTLRTRKSKACVTLLNAQTGNKSMDHFTQSGGEDIKCSADRFIQDRKNNIAQN